ncbi:hypothetical protein ACIQUB_16680 [Rhizobium sp. NPDC090275]|uniref:hypothetical protein n=1 Tax=Rhizobium sp. NPDC090275 TaxID=3364498 RepID=UPI00383A4B55
MDAYVFSTDHAGSHRPYLIVPDQNSPRPGHPAGKSWVPWKAVKLEEQIFGHDRDRVAKAVEAEGYFISE